MKPPGFFVSLLRQILFVLTAAILCLAFARPAMGQTLEAAIPIASNSCCTNVAVNQNTNQIYVSGGFFGGPVVTWINGNTNTVVKDLGTGVEAQVNPITNKIYAAGVFSGNILVYSGADGSLIKSVPGFGCPIGAVVDPNNDHIWGIGECGGGNDPVFVIDGSTDTLISGYIGMGFVNFGAVVNPVTHILYERSKEVNPTTFAVTNTPFVNPVVAANANPSNNRLYALTSTGYQVIDGSTESVIGSLTVSQPGQSAAVNLTRNRFYAVSSATPQIIYVFDGTSNALIGTIPFPSGYTFGGGFPGLAVNSNNGKLYASATDSAGKFFLLVIHDTTSITVAIDIKPGEDPSSINPKSHGKIPVAILSRSTFDATTQVDRTSLTFGHTGDEQSLAFCNPGGEDVNGDGLPDLVCHFSIQRTGFQTGDTVGVLKGKTVAGTPIMGMDSIRIVP